MKKLIRQKINMLICEKFNTIIEISFSPGIEKTIYGQALAARIAFIDLYVCILSGFV
jgi:hypothetical protein